MRTVDSLQKIGLNVLCWACVATVAAMPAAARELPILKPVMECAGLAETDVDSAGEPPARIITARLITSTTAAPYCEVRGYVAPQVNFELRLPTENYMQRLLFSGCGGFCGRIDFRLRAVEGCAAVENSELAVVATDLGHNTPDGNADTVWAAGSSESRADYGFRGVHVVAVAAKTIIASFYGHAPVYSYFNGCSDGGREALMEVQRYPTDFNGVVAGAAVINDTANNTIFHAWSAQHLRRADGSPMFTAADLGVLHRAALEACDVVGDGLKDGVIGNPLACHFDPALIQCREASVKDCLSAEQVAAARALYTGPQDPSGHALYYGRPVGSELQWGGPDVAAYVRSFMSHMTTDTPPKPFDLASVTYDAQALARYNAQAQLFNALDTDIRSFEQAGGKLIMWHGWGDPGVPPMSSVDYYNSVRHTLGEGVTRFIRLYMLPGVGHCGGGDGPDKLNLMDPIMRWVEDGVAPEKIEVSRKSFGRVQQTRPIFPFPATARYVGHGDPQSAGSFVAAAPR